MTAIRTITRLQDADDAPTLGACQVGRAGRGLRRQLQRALVLHGGHERFAALGARRQAECAGQQQRHGRQQRYRTPPGLLPFANRLVLFS